MAKGKRNGPLGNSGQGDDDHDSRVIEDHIALQNQSDVSPEDYPAEERQAQSLVQKDKRKR